MAHPVQTSSSSLASYLPRVLVERIASARPIAGAELHRGSGAVLISDVEGFTALVEKYGRRGREGLEELTWTLNRYVSDLVDIIYAGGGDVLSIAGDALLCYWPATSNDDADVATAAMAATRAGFAIQTLLHSGGASNENQFNTRIGIGAGGVDIAFVGGLNGRWDLAAGGRAFSDAVGAEKAARSGEVLLSQRAFALLSASIKAVGDATAEHVRVIDPGEAAAVSNTPAPIAADDQLRPFLPLSVRARLADAGSLDIQWLAETRRLSVLMTELPALTTGDDAELARMNDAVRAFQDVIERCEGASRVDLDEKGVLLLAAFGVPPRAHENDAERAAHAATLLAGEFSALGVSAGIGVATGRAFCGAFGSDRRRDYMIRGDVINLAARLMRAAEGDICCDADTMTASARRMSFETLSPVMVKGRSDPVALFRPIARREAALTSNSEMVGRATERAVLLSALENLRAGKGDVIVLEGEAGLGKSRLLADAMESASASGVRVMKAAADAIERTTPNFAWRQTFSALLGLSANGDSAAARAQIDDYMRRFPDWQRFTPLLGDVLPVRIDDNELTRDMAADVRAENTKQLLAALLRDMAASAPTLLAVEDAHWLDSGSWALLLEAVRSIPALLVVVTSRPHAAPLPLEFARLIAVAGDERLCLESLSPEEMTSLIARELDVASVPSELARFVYERVSGHPFFCEELVRAMRDIGAIRIEDGRCIIGELGTFNLPTTVEGVIVSRLDRLTPPQQLCLKVAAVIGRIFRARLLEDTYPLPAERSGVRDNLHELSELDLTALESLEPDLAYLFKHVITRDVTYDMLPLARRQPLHRAVAEWYERTYAADLSPHLGLLAYHWVRAANPPKALEYLEKAGQFAARTGAFREGVQLLTQAVELMDSGAVPMDVTRRALAQRTMGTAAYFLGDFPQVRTQLSAALAVLDRPVPSSRGAVISGALKALGRQVKHQVMPKRYLGRRSTEKAIIDETVEGYKSLTQAVYMEGAGPEWLLYLTTSGLNLGEEAGDSAPLASVMINASMMSYLMGMKSASERFAARAIAMAEQESEYAAAAFVWHIRGLTLAQQAKWPEFRDANERALALVRQLGDVGLESEVWLVRSTVAHCAGDFRAAPEAWTRMRELAERNGNSAMRCWSLLDEVETRLAQGDLEEAERALAEALAIQTPESDLGMRLEKLRAVMGVNIRRGGSAEAEGLAAANEIVDLLGRTSPTGYHMADHFAAALEGYLLLLKGNPSRNDAKALMHRLVRGAKQLTKFSRTFVHVQPRSLLVRGMLSARQGDVRNARRHLLAAVTRARELSMPLEEGRALLELSLLSDEREPAVLIESARALIETTGASWYAPQVVSEAR